MVNDFEVASLHGEIVRMRAENDDILSMLTQLKRENLDLAEKLAAAELTITVLTVQRP